MTKQKLINTLDKVAEVFGTVHEAFTSIKEGLEKDDVDMTKTGIDQLPNARIVNSAIQKCGDLIDEKPWLEWLDELSEDASA